MSPVASILPVVIKLPVISTTPWKLWVSSILSPNWVEPDSKITDEVTNSVWNSCATIVPSTSNLPAIDAVVPDSEYKLNVEPVLIVILSVVPSPWLNSKILSVIEEDI